MAFFKRIHVITVILLVFFVIYISVLYYAIFFNNKYLPNLVGFSLAVVISFLLMMLLQKHGETSQKLSNQEFLIDEVKQSMERVAKVQSYRDLRNHILIKIEEVLKVKGLAVRIVKNDKIVSITTGIFDSDKCISVLNIGKGMPGTVSFPIYANDESSAELIVAPKINNDSFMDEELSALALIVNYFSLTIENLDLIEKLGFRLDDMFRQFGTFDNNDQSLLLQKILFQFQERERARIATDMHDTVLQDAYFLQQKLSMDRIDQEDALEQIKALNHTIRVICFELYPHTLEIVGLVSSLNYLLTLNREQYPFSVETRFDQTEQVERIGLDVKKFVFRMIQELLNNAIKHSSSTVVHLAISANADHVRFTYSDNGVGYSFPDYNTISTNHKGFGLVYIVKRIKEFNAEFEFQSEPSKGASIQIKIPIG